MPPWGRQYWAVIQLYEKKKANHANLLRIITYCLWTEGVCPDYREKMEKTMNGRAAKICGVLGTVGILTVLYMTGESYYSGLTGGAQPGAERNADLSV